jgi:glycerol-3-phosphate O-acyltransferase
LELLKDFYLGYHNVVPQKADSLFITFLALIKEQTLSPFTFEPFHRQIRTPFDYYQFGLDLIRPLVDQPASSLRGLPYLAEIVSLIEKGENVIFLANHQVEADPQAISLLLEDHSPRLAEEMIFVAGERVITDPLAIPASKGRNLLCIYSKRYIDNPPEHKSEKQRHNRKTMELMSALLSEGGKAIYVAPSGGRDRPNPDGVFTVSPYDAQSIEMFYLMAERAGHPTHFYPLALKTYAILPPPQTIQVELGEARTVAKAPIHLSLGPRIDMEHFPGSDIPDKHARRSARATYIHSLVSTDYSQFP